MCNTHHSIADRFISNCAASELWKRESCSRRTVSVTFWGNFCICISRIMTVASLVCFTQATQVIPSNVSQFSWLQKSS